MTGQSGGPRLPNVDAYDVLKVNIDATDDDIKKAYRKLSLQLHPDKQASNANASAEDFTILKDAYDILSDTNRRKFYDRFGVDLGEEGLETAIWNTSTQAFLGPYGRFLIKLTLTSLVAHLFEYTYVFALLKTAVLGGIGYCGYKLKTMSASTAQEDIEKNQLMQVCLIYLGIVEGYIILTLLSTWLADSFFLLVLVAETCSPFIFTNFIALGVAAVVSFILGWLFQGYWSYVIGGFFFLGLFGLFSSLLATILVHLWLDSVETTTKVQVKTHREKMRQLKEIAKKNAIVTLPQPRKSR